VPAGKLNIGDVVRTATGARETVVSTKRGGRETVFNIEVNGTHTYMVGPEGILVHNRKMLD
jgi:hypothetical protein